MGDGHVDKVYIDTTGDGIADVVGFDTTGDGKIDAYDTTGCVPQLSSVLSGAFLCVTGIGLTQCRATQGWKN